MTLTLKGCPFCGRKPRVCPDDSYGACVILCVCDVEPAISGPIGTLEKLAEEWNTRARHLEYVVEVDE